MTPDIGMRLGTIARALQQVVIPALPADQVLAIEQATLCLGHLGIIGRQLAFVADYDAAGLADMTDLAAGLAEGASGGEHTQAAATALRTVLDRSGASAGDLAATAKEQRNDLAASVDTLIRAAGVDGTPEFVAESQRLVIEHGLRQTHRDRAWFRDSGLDPDRAGLPDIPELLAPR